MKTQTRSLMHSTTRTFTAAALAAALTMPSFAEAGQKPVLIDPSFEVNASLEALSSAMRDIQEQFAAQKREGQARGQERGQERQRDAQWDVQYERARQAIERAQWSQAVQQFTMLAQANAPRADAAMYWRAYSLDKLNRHADALAAVSDLFKSFPASRWISDARALELQVKQRTGQPVPVETGDEELKLLAIQGLQQTAPERAVPLLVKVINDVGSLRLKERALFVLSQSSAAEARTTIEKVARGGSNPELQIKAVQYIAMSGLPGKVTVLNNVYTDSSDIEVKRQVLRAFTMTGDRQRILTAAQTEKTPELRTEAVHQLGFLGARDELWQMYQKEQAVEVKRTILNSLAMTGATPRMAEVVAIERDPQLRILAVRQLGMMGGKAGTDTLVNLYAKESDTQVRRAVIQALSFQGPANVDALVSMARKETNPELRREIVRVLSFMGNSPAAIEYLQEILEK
jgi:HEAT repeat protein